MPKQTNIDWEVAKSLRREGLPYTAIAKRLDCNSQTLRSRAFREKWDASIAKSLEIMRQEPIADEERAKKWTNDMLAVCEKKLELLKKSDPAKLKPKDLQLMSQVLRTIDDLTRRTLRLDEPTSQKGAFTVVVLDNSTPSTHVCLNDIVEDTEPIASPARVLERLQD